MHYMKPEHIFNFFKMLTKPTSIVEFTVNDTSAVVMWVLDNNDASAATLISTHENPADANTAKDVYAAAFKVYRKGIASRTEEDAQKHFDGMHLIPPETEMDDEVNLQMTLEMQ